MAYLPDEQNQQGQGAGPVNGQADGTAGAAPITSSPAPSGAGASGGKTINQASSQGPAQPFTNLQTYLSANAPQIQQQGNAIAGTLNNQFGGAIGAVDQATGDFGKAVDSGYAHPDSTVVNKFAQDPTAVNNDPNMAASFKGQYNDKYTGPSSFETSSGYGAANDAVNKAASSAKTITAPGGISSYLMSQSPTETQGMATLDSALVGGSKDAMDTINNAATKVQNVPSYLTGAATTANASVAAAQAQADAARTAAQNVGQQAQSGLSQSLAAELAAANTAYKGANDTYAKDYGAYSTLSHIPDQLKALISSYAGPTIDTPTAPTMATPSYANVANQGEFDRAAAIQALTGLASPLSGLKSDAAGTFNPNYTDTFGAQNTAGRIAQPLFDPSNPAYTQQVPSDKISSINDLLKILNGYNPSVPLSAITPNPVNTSPTIGGGTSPTTPPPTSGGGGIVAR